MYIYNQSIIGRVGDNNWKDYNCVTSFSHHVRLDNICSIVACGSTSLIRL